MHVDDVLARETISSNIRNREAWDHQEKNINFDLKGLASLPSLVFLGFLIYAVSVSNIDTVRDACGPSLWTYMLLRLVLSFVVIFFITSIAGCLAVYFDSSILQPIISVIILTIYSATMLVVGLTIVTRALTSAKCVAALSASCFTNSPMLAILGCIFVGFDALLLLVLISFSCLFIFS
jgi:hypothetical protein